MPDRPLHVAIIGGGLCGLSLAIALTRRNISHTIYEARASFTEIGAGINLGPNCLEAFQLIDPDLEDGIRSLVTRNPGRQADVWMNVRLGAASGQYEDAELIHQIIASPSGTGNMTVSRNELLQFLALRTKPENAKFNKKLANFEQLLDGVKLTFEDDTVEFANVVVACDGAHSASRRLLLGADHPATIAKFSHTGGYRAVFDMEDFERLVGQDQAAVSTVRLGPGGYIITYPIDAGKRVNVGVWPWKKDEWTAPSWVLPNQKKEMLEDFRAWGPTAQKLMAAMGDDTAFWATFHHAVQPESYFEGRVAIVGDAAHAMCPHQGQGASQAMEDACVIADVLDAVNNAAEGASSRMIGAALKGYQSVRKPRFEKALETSMSAFSFWSDLWHESLSSAEIHTFKGEADARFPYLWHARIAEQCAEARKRMTNVVR